MVRYSAGIGFGLKPGSRDRLLASTEPDHQVCRLGIYLTGCKPQQRKFALFTARAAPSLSRAYPNPTTAGVAQLSEPHGVDEVVDLATALGHEALVNPGQCEQLF